MGTRRPSLPKILAKILAKILVKTLPKILANTCKRHIRHALPTHT